MSSGKVLQPTKYAKHRYNITQPISFDAALNYGGALMAIAGSDGELAPAELQWYIDEQEMLLAESQELVEALRQFDWRQADIEQLLDGISYDFPLNFRRAMLYQSIKMCRADGRYSDQERATVAKAAAILDLDISTLVSLESLAELEDSTTRLRLSLLEAIV